MSQELVLVIIGLVVAAIVLRPLVRTRAKPLAAPMVRDPGPAVASADELAELELDHAMGRVSDADYERWRGEVGAAPAPVPDENHDPVTTDAVVRAELLVRHFRERRAVSCAKCGERPEPDARYCSNCGSLLS